MGSLKIADIARNYETEAGHQILYSEMVCNQFVVAVLRKAVAPDFPMTLANDFVRHSSFTATDTPAAGDLVHWPGHIGIVLDPDQGEFIGSQTSTGVEISNYKKGWWSGQYGGKTPDYFLRYIK